MILAYWNSLRVGDRVLVHDVSPLGAPLRQARVAVVDARYRDHGIGVRVQDGTTPGAAIGWPARLRVHLDPLDSTDACRWCTLPRSA